MKFKLFTVLAFLVAATYDLAAQPNLPGISEDGPGNVDDTPIHFLIYPLLILGSYLGYKTFNKKNN